MGSIVAISECKSPPYFTRSIPANRSGRQWGRDGMGAGVYGRSGSTIDPCTGRCGRAQSLDLVAVARGLAQHGAGSRVRRLHGRRYSSRKGKVYVLKRPIDFDGSASAEGISRPHICLVIPSQIAVRRVMISLFISKFAFRDLLKS